MSAQSGAHRLLVVIETARELPNVNFVPVGDGAEWDRLINEAEALDNVSLPGRVEEGAVPYMLAASDVSLVHLKPREVFETVIPSKILEAMAARLPIVLGVRG